MVDGNNSGRASGTRPHDEQRHSISFNLFIPFIFGILATIIMFFVSISEGDFSSFGITLLTTCIFGLCGWITKKIYLHNAQSKRNKIAIEILINVDSYFEKAKAVQDTIVSLTSLDRNISQTQYRNLQNSNQNSPEYKAKMWRIMLICFSAFCTIAMLFVCAIDESWDIMSDLVPQFFFIFVIPLFIPAFIYMIKVKKQNSSYDAKKDYIIYGIIAVVYIILFVTGIVVGNATTAANNYYSSQNNIISSTLSNDDNSDANNNNVNSNSQDVVSNAASTTTNDDSNQQSTTTENTTYNTANYTEATENNSSKDNNTTSNSQEDDTPKENTFTSQMLVNSWNNATDKIYNYHHINDFTDNSSGSNIGFTIHFNMDGVDMNLSTNKSKTSFTVKLSNIEITHLASEYCYDAIATFSENYSDNSFYRDFDNNWTTIDENNEKKSCSYYGYNCTITLKVANVSEYGSKSYECTMTASKY